MRASAATLREVVRPAVRRASEHTTGPARERAGIGRRCRARGVVMTTTAAAADEPATTTTTTTTATTASGETNEGPRAKRTRNRDPRELGVTGKRAFTVKHGGLLMTSEGVYGDLKLNEAARKVKGVRVRQHVNPLSSRFQVQAPSPVWREVYDDAMKPLTIDIGCAGGRFDLLLAKRQPERNVLGVDIREPLVERGLSWGEASGIVGNIHFATCNATVSIGEWVKSYRALGGEVELVTILHPDPHFKSKHKKRRIVQKQLVEQLAREMHPGTRVYLQSDVEELTEDMRKKFERYCDGCFDLDPELHDVEAARAKAETVKDEPLEDPDAEDDGWRSTWVHGGWLSENPLGVPSEREVQTLGEGLPVFRVMLRRTEKKCEI